MRNSNSNIEVGYFPYRPGANPYQLLFSNSLEHAGLNVRRLSPKKWFPLGYAANQKCNILQLDWPHDWYMGRNVVSQKIKRLMYRSGLRAIRNQKTIWTAHNLWSHDAKDQVDEVKMLQRLIDSLDGIIVLSDVAGKMLRANFTINKETIVRKIYHGHYIDVYPNTVTRTEARRVLGLQQSGRVVLSLGRLMPYKGLTELVQSFATCATAGDILLIVGPCLDQEFLGHLRAEASRYCSKKVRIKIKAGFIDETELQLYFNSCDLVALPFRDILNSGSLLLAMSFGTVIVAPRAGSIPEIVLDEACFCYDPTATGGLTTALTAAMSSTDLVERSRRVLEFTRDKYSWANVGRSARQLYEEILGQ